MSAALSTLSRFPVADAVAPAPPFTELRLGAKDGTPLAARHYPPRADDGPRRARGAVFIAPAMGVAQRFYEPLATWLAGEGLHVLTFDYRGSGASRTRPLRRETADIMTWAEDDTATAFAALVSRAATSPRPGATAPEALPITWLGHSLGGQIVPFVPGAERATKIVTIATGSGYWRQNAPPTRRKVWLFWWGFVPLATPLFGYFPGKRLGMVGDLPRGVIRQWRRWCLDPEYAVGVVPGARARFDAVTAPVTSISFSDDEMMSAASIDTLHGFFRNSARHMVRVAPEHAGVARIGHFGFFRREMEAPLWRARLLPELARVPDPSWA